MLLLEVLQNVDHQMAMGFYSNCEGKSCRKRCDLRQVTVYSASNGKVISVFLLGEMTEIERQGDINEDTEAMKWLCTCIEMAPHKPGIWLFISIREGIEMLKTGNQLYMKSAREKRMFGCCFLVVSRGVEWYEAV